LRLERCQQGNLATWAFSFVHHGVVVAYLEQKRKARSVCRLISGIAVFNRPTNIFIALPLTVYILFHHRAKFWAYSVLAGIPAFFFCLYSYTHWGTVSYLGQALRLSGFYGTVLSGLAGLLVSPSRGLLVSSPIFIFSFGYILYGLISKRLEPIYKYLVVSLFALLMVYAKWPIWWGGHSFAYRLLIELTPILIIFLALCWENVIEGRIFAKGIFSCLLAVSIYIHFLGAFYYPSGFN
jgi:hypothetical protein